MFIREDRCIYRTLCRKNEIPERRCFGSQVVDNADLLKELGRSQPSKDELKVSFPPISRSFSTLTAVNRRSTARNSFLCLAWYCFSLSLCSFSKGPKDRI